MQQLADALRVEDAQRQALLSQSTGLQRQRNGLLQRIGRFARPNNVGASPEHHGVQSPQQGKKGIAKDWVQFLMEEANAEGRAGGKENSAQQLPHAEDSMEGAPASVQPSEGSPPAGAGSAPRSEVSAAAPVPG